MDAVRALIAGYLQTDVRDVTDNAHLSHDLGADWLDRLELLIRLEDLTGVEITHNELDQIEYIGDLIRYIGEKSSAWLAVIGRGIVTASCARKCRNDAYRGASNLPFTSPG
jgi:acyl carrier protein